MIDVQKKFNSLIRSFFYSKETKNTITQTIIDRLSKTGVAGDGNKLRTDKAKKGNTSRGFYSLYTEYLKSKKGHEINHVTLSNTGIFYKSITAKLEGSTLIITAQFKKRSGNISDNFSDSYNKEEFEEVVLTLTEEETQRLLALLVQQTIVNFRKSSF
jgi:hypothetical protein